MNRYLGLQLVLIGLFFALIASLSANLILGYLDHSHVQQGLLVIIDVFCCAGAGVGMLLAYLRYTSHEARQVIRQIRAGDPTARVPIQRLDEQGRLKLDFNTLADEIETLAGHVKVADTARRDLLRALNHDLRTPLTSLTTTIDTLHQYCAKMSPEQQQETLNVALRELNYLLRLLEDMTFIAELPRPDFGGEREIVRLHELCEDLIQTRENAQPQVHWFLQDKTGHDAHIEGSTHLMLRLLRNSLDNAIRFANYQISITLDADDTWVYLTIDDDGPGMDQQAIALFGTRRTQRMLGKGAAAGLSLGLGSVMISAITRLHGGKLAIANRSDTAAGSTGAVLHFRFPRKRHDAA